MTADDALAHAQTISPQCRRFVVRLFDGMDGEWMDVTKPLTAAAAKREWAKRTENGNRCTNYNDIDYYAIYPADTRMRFADGNSMTRGKEG